MNRVVLLLGIIFLLACSSNVRFLQTDDSYTPAAKSPSARIVFKKGPIERPHRVIGIIEAELGKKATRAELDALLLQKAREIGADGLHYVDYDVDRAHYMEKHHKIVGRGPYRRHVVRSTAKTAVKKSVQAVAVIFE